ncbi:MAG: elongation factor G [Myxococcales bacterium]|nr:elongation factor G [Myxococcales bacterium]
MKLSDSKQIRNVGFVGHGHCGKTSLGEAMIFSAGASTRLCRVDDGNTNLDFEPEEIKRRGSISTSFFSVEWNKHKLNLVDMPGDVNFFNDTRACIQAVDAVVLVVSAADGVEVGTDRSWELIRQLKLPCAIVINKMDRERASFQGALEDIRSHLSGSATAVQIPIGKEHDYRGFVDILSGKAYEFATDGSGTFKEVPVPADLQDELEASRESLMESVAENDEALLDKFCEEGELDADELRHGLIKGVRTGGFIPVFCSSATHNIGAQHVMDFVVEIFPSPVDRPAWKGAHPTTGEPIERASSPDEPFSALIFKTIVDPYTGKLTVFRVCSGSLGGDDNLYIPNVDTKERFGTVFELHGKKTEALEGAICGDIVTVAKLKEATTGQTFADEKHPVVYTMLPTLPPVMSFAIHPKSQGDEDKMGSALHRLAEEDPSLHLMRDEQFNEFLLQGMGQVHIETMIDRLKRKFGVEVTLSTPRVPYRETIKGTASAQGKYKKQTGGRGQFGDAHVEISPLPRGGGFEFQDAIVGGVIPRQFIPAVEKGIIETMEKGIVAGYPVVDLKAKLYFGSYHTVDSSEMAFKVAGSMAFKKAFEDAKPVLLEPVMMMDIIVPEESLGDVMGDINSRRGRVQGMEAKGRNQVIRALVPMSEVLQYSPDLNSMTGGRGTFTMEMSHYEEVPGHLADKVIAESKKADDEK